MPSRLVPSKIANPLALRQIRYLHLLKLLPLPPEVTHRSHHTASHQELHFVTSIGLLAVSSSLPSRSSQPRYDEEQHLEQDFRGVMRGDITLASLLLTIDHSLSIDSPVQPCQDTHARTPLTRSLGDRLNILNSSRPHAFLPMPRSDPRQVPPFLSMALLRDDEDKAKWQEPWNSGL